MNAPLPIDIVMAYPQILLDRARHHIVDAILLRRGGKYDRSLLLSRRAAARALHLVRLHNDVDYAIKANCSAHQRLILAENANIIFGIWETFVPERREGNVKFHSLPTETQLLFRDIAESQILTRNRTLRRGGGYGLYWAICDWSEKHYKSLPRA